MHSINRCLYSVVLLENMLVMWLASCCGIMCEWSLQQHALSMANVAKVIWFTMHAN